MRLDELAGRRVALLGLGVDVRAALERIRAAGPAELTLVDGSVDGPTHEAMEVLSLDRAAARAEVVVRSPGFPRYQRPLLDALERGVRMTTPVDLWIGSRPAGQKVVGVTGTKGKSTTSHLIARLADEAGLRVGMAGNMGVPIFGDGWDAGAPVVVVEISSYQAADLHTVPDIAVLTSLSEDHVDWHGGRDSYVRDKLRVLGNDGAVAASVLVAADDAAAVAAAEPYGAVVVHAPEPDGSVPRHRVQNAALAAAVVAELGGPRPDDARIVDAARASLPGRLDLCDGPRRAMWIDDALASNPSAAAAGLAWARGLDRPTIVLLGGADRGVDPSPLVDEVGRWPAGRLRAVVLPDNGERLAHQTGIEILGHAEDVAAAVALAGDHAVEGDVVLFSPAAPTPQATGDWKVRSAAFRQAVSLVDWVG